MGPLERKRSPRATARASLRTLRVLTRRPRRAECVRQGALGLSCGRTPRLKRLRCAPIDVFTPHDAAPKRRWACSQGAALPAAGAPPRPATMRRPKSRSHRCARRLVSPRPSCCSRGCAHNVDGAATHARPRVHSRPTHGGLPCSLAALRVRAVCGTDARSDAHAPEPARRMRSSSERRRSFSAAMRAEASACSSVLRSAFRFFRRRR